MKGSVEMIKTEKLTIKRIKVIDGKKVAEEKALIKTYSDSGMMIERDGVRYSEAIDPAELNRQYTETDEPIKDGDM